MHTSRTSPIICRTRPLPEISSNSRPSKKRKAIEPKTVEPNLIVDGSLLRHIAMARSLEGTELSPIGIFSQYWDESILRQIVDSANAHSWAKGGPGSISTMEADERCRSTTISQHGHPHGRYTTPVPASVLDFIQLLAPTTPPRYWYLWYVDLILGMA